MWPDPAPRSTNNASNPAPLSINYLPNFLRRPSEEFSRIWSKWSYLKHCLVWARRQLYLKVRTVNIWLQAAQSLGSFSLLVISHPGEPWGSANEKINRRSRWDFLWIFYNHNFDVYETRIGKGKIDNWGKWHGFCSVNSFDQTFCQVKDKVSIWWFLLRQSKESICWLENLKAPSFSWKLPCTMNGQHVNHTQNLIVCLNFNDRSFLICHCLVTGDTGGLLLCSQTRVSGHTIGTGGFGSFTHSWFHDHVNLASDSVLLKFLIQFSQFVSPISHHYFRHSSHVTFAKEFKNETRDWMDEIQVQVCFINARQQFK